MNNFSKILLAIVACFILYQPAKAMMPPVFDDFIGDWTSTSGNILEYRKNGNQIEVIMSEPSSSFKELGYIPGEITGHYQFLDGKIKGKILLKFMGCQPIWTSASNEIDSNGLMAVQVPLLRCNRNTGNWEFLGGSNTASLKKVLAEAPPSGNAQEPNVVGGTGQQDQKMPDNQTPPPQIEPSLANDLKSPNSEITPTNVSHGDNPKTKFASSQDAENTNSNPTSAKSPLKSILENFGGGCMVLGVVLFLFGINVKRDRRFSSGYRGGSSTAVLFGLVLVVIGAVLVYIPITLFIGICVTPFAFMLLHKAFKKSEEDKEKKAEEERVRILRIKRENEERIADEIRDTLLAKYQDDQIVDKIIARKFWLGQTAEQLTDALGRPEHIGNQTKSGEVWKYFEVGKNRYDLHIHLRNDVVVDWKDNR